MDFSYRNLEEKWSITVPSKDDDTLVNSVIAFILHYYPNQFYRETILDEHVNDDITELITRPFDKQEFSNKFPNIQIKKV